MKTTALLIGRFQHSEVPSALKGFIEQLISKNNLVGIIIGNNKTGATRRNPLDVDSRKEMLSDQFPTLQIFSIDDHPSDGAWSEALDQLVKKNFNDGVVLFGSDDGFIARYSGLFRVASTGRKHDPDLSAATRKRSGSREHREGVIHGLSRTYAKVYATVDMALLRNDKKEILLGMKGIEKKWRLLGGFSDPDDESYEHAVRRELQEECGLTEIRALHYEKSFKVDDWRYRNEEDKIITVLFSAEYVSGDAKGSDDIEEVKWFSWNEVGEFMLSGNVAGEHWPLFTYLLEKFQK